MTVRLLVAVLIGRTSSSSKVELNFPELVDLPSAFETESKLKLKQ